MGQRRSRVLAGMLALLFAVGTVVIILSIWPGWFTIEIAATTFSIMGVLLMGRAIVQQIFAAKNNNRMREIVRDEILNVAIPDFQKGEWKPSYNIMYHKWVKWVWQTHPRLKRQWTRIMNDAVNNAAAAAGLPLKKVGVGIPAHGLTLPQIRRTVESLRRQTYRVSHIIVVLNGHVGDPIEAEVRRYIDGLNDERVEFHSLPEPHKRAAMAFAYRRLNELGCDEIDNADADTSWHHDAVAVGLIVKYRDQRVKAITSNVLIEKRQRDWLSWLTWLRYLYANMVERAAESWFYCVGCMSGPCMQCRAVDIMELLDYPDEWEFQLFAGERVGPGDDRTLTQRLLSRGHGVAFVPDVICWTECPATIAIWKRQQLRWSRSGLRGFVVIVKTWWFWQRYALLTILDEFYLAYFTFLLTLVALVISYRAIFAVLEGGVENGVGYVLPYLFIVFFVNAARPTVFAVIMRDARMLGLMAYPYLVVRYLVRIKFHALITLPNSNWGTRGPGQPSDTWRQRFRRLWRRRQR